MKSRVKLDFSLASCGLGLKRAGAGREAGEGGIMEAAVGSCSKNTGGGGREARSHMAGSVEYDVHEPEGPGAGELGKEAGRHCRSTSCEVA